MRRETFDSRASACAALGLGPEAVLDDARAAYRRLARVHHPDAGGDAATFERVAAAWDFLERHPDPGDEPAAARAASGATPVRPRAEDAPALLDRPTLPAFGAGCLGLVGFVLVVGALGLVALLAGGADEPAFAPPALAVPEPAQIRSAFVAPGSDPREGASPARAYLVVDPAGLTEGSLVAAAEAGGWEFGRTGFEDGWFSHEGITPAGHPAYLGDLDAYLDMPSWFILDGDAAERLARFENRGLALVQVFAPVPEPAADPVP